MTTSPPILQNHPHTLRHAIAMSAMSVRKMAEVAEVADVVETAENPASVVVSVETEVAEVAQVVPDDVEPHNANAKYLMGDIVESLTSSRCTPDNATYDLDCSVTILEHCLVSCGPAQAPKSSPRPPMLAPHPPPPPHPPRSTP